MLLCGDDEGPRSNSVPPPLLVGVVDEVSSRRILARALGMPWIWAGASGLVAANLDCCRMGVGGGAGGGPLVMPVVFMGMPTYEAG